MSIDYDNEAEDMIVECDECGEETTVAGEFIDCIKQLKRDGWRITKDDKGDWIHFCSNDCMSAYLHKKEK
jgi:hypothetical protein